MKKKLDWQRPIDKKKFGFGRPNPTDIRGHSREKELDWRKADRRQGAQSLISTSS